MFVSRLGAALLLGTASLVACGCDSPQAEEKPAPVVKQETPEELLGLIVESLKRRVEDSSLRDASALDSFGAAPGTPMTDATITVSHEYLPPAGDNEPHRAKLVFATKSTVTMILPGKEQEEEAVASEGDLVLEEEIEGVPPLESLVVPSVTKNRSTGPSEQRLSNEEESVYELEFRGDKWELVTEIDREAEPFNALAIEYALNRQ